MDLTETRSSHPNLIAAADAASCTIRSTVYRESVIIPSHHPVSICPASTVPHLSQDTFLALCTHEPELIILATGDEIIFPDPDVLEPLVKHRIGLEVLTNQAAARTFNVLLAESRRTVCLMLLNG